MTVYLILVEMVFGEWTRVGRVHRDKEVAKNWKPFVRKYWRRRTKIKEEVIPLVDGKPTEEAIRRFSEVYNIDLVMT